MSTREERMSRVNRKLDTTETGKIESRPKRVPMAGNRDVLTVQGKDPNYHYHYFSDIDTRIQKALAAGYEFVDAKDVKLAVSAVDATSDMGSVAKKVVGNGTVAYLMRIPMEWYNEDQAAKQKDLDSKLAGMYASQKDKLGKGAYGDFETTNK